jgi:hypothetical protein
MCAAEFKSGTVQAGLKWRCSSFAAAAGQDGAGFVPRRLPDGRPESGRAASAVESLESAAEIKEKQLRILEQHERDGLDPPEIYPHPDDIIFDEATSEIAIHGPISKEQAEARKAVRQLALESMRRYFEVEAALKKDPSNRKLRREFKELKKYYDFLKDDAARNIRLEALRLSRQAPEPKPPETEDDTPETEDDTPGEA